jgi:hypothetical protein
MTTAKQCTDKRSLHDIAFEIRSSWPRMYFGARPHVEAMQSLCDVTDKYGYEDGRSIVRYFLANAGTWRGDVARRVKAELKGML